MTKKRVKIPNETEGLLIYKSNLSCCVCSKKGDHIHHLDGNSNNNNIDNLALLCFEHHNLATIKNSLSKTLKKEAIIKYREHHYKVIENKRQNLIGILDNPITDLTDEKLLTISKNAIIILELENIKKEYFNSEWEKRPEILDQLMKYTNHINNRLSYEILDFLSLAANQTRFGLTEDVALGIHNYTIYFCPKLYNKTDRDQAIELVRECVHIGHNIAYDAFIHLKKLSIAMYGLLIIKFVYLKSKEMKLDELSNVVIQAYEDLTGTLLRKERTDLGDALELLKIFHEDIKVWKLAFPGLPKHLMTIIENERKK